MNQGGQEPEDQHPEQSMWPLSTRPGLEPAAQEDWDLVRWKKAEEERAAGCQFSPDQVALYRELTTKLGQAWIDLREDQLHQPQGPQPRLSDDKLSSS